MTHAIRRNRRRTSVGLSVLLWGAFGVWLAGCASNSNTVAAGQLFCAKATATGPLVVALADAFGAPVIATGMASQIVAANCAVIGAIPVAPPAVPAAAPVVAAVLPKVAT